MNGVQGTAAICGRKLWTQTHGRLRGRESREQTQPKTQADKLKVAQASRCQPARMGRPRGPSHTLRAFFHTACGSPMLPRASPCWLSGSLAQSQRHTLQGSALLALPLSPLYALGNSAVWVEVARPRARCVSCCQDRHSGKGPLHVLAILFDN